MREENQNQGDLKLKQQSIGIGKDSASTGAVSRGKSEKLAALSSSDNTSALQAVILERKLKYQEKPENAEPKTEVKHARLGGDKKLSFRRRFTNNAIGASMWLCGLLVLAILISIGYELISRGIGIISPYFLSVSMKGVYGGMQAGGIYHAMVGTLLITLVAAVISVPLGLAVAIYLTEYAGNTKFAKLTTTLVDVMTGIPSIVAGLFAAALFTIVIGPAYRSGLMGAVALSVLMIPLVVRSSAEMLRLVPNDLREASYALGVPKWRTVVSIVLRTSAAGLVTSVVVAIARIVGETAPLLITAGMFDAINSNVFSGRMETLPVYIYQQYTSTVSCAAHAVNCSPTINVDRAWGAALVLVFAVLVLNLGARFVAKKLSIGK
ncbi:MAG: phosphate ABC transporter permease PstA [Varibaculum cambriense]|uniref:phosphate ABC transporter permease PstA n=1 Tax=Varibaculum cambriense TaxID=184870 RepID=UPI00241F2E64|nr:phosphate ABC transporter permease PstA [Varibaculum cambriense]MDU5247263.1 phosphate ABC transporter permease PstA [Varibaculum cambriense]MDU5307398.1 phosphate ABC transporter permease PstA [Varibaculum cambriense]MDU5854060.1 phosphate ABC transporter permease PstA [Varibaculum cambriense]MDU6680898.1 phosphate ABC transporter permease PstA [Varibaculum cambriense]